MDKPRRGADVAKASSRLSLLTMASRVLGLVRDMTRGSVLGTGAQAEAFSVAFIIPNLMRRLFAEGSISAAFIPVFKESLAKDDQEGTRSLLSATFTVLLVLTAIVVAAGIAFADWIVLLYDVEARAETVLLTRIMFPFLSLVSFAALYQGILNSVGVFAPSGMAPIVFNLAFIFLPLGLSPFLPGHPARLMAIAVTVGGMLQALCQLPSVLKHGFRFGLMPPAAAFRHPGLRRILALVGPTVLGMAAYEINSLVSSALASSQGAVTALSFSLRLQELVLGVFVVSLGTVILPVLTGQAQSGDWDGYGERLRSSLDAVSLVTIPIAAYCMMEGRDIVALVYGRGAFGESSIDLTTGAFFWHMAGLFFIGQNRILAPAFYARSDTKSPTFAGMASFGVNILTALLLVGPMGGGGIALALSIASAVNTVILVILILRSGRVRPTVLGASALYALKILGFSLLAALVVTLLSGPVHAWLGGMGGRILRNGLPMLILSASFALVGVFLLILTRDKNLRFLLERFRKPAH